MKKILSFIILMTLAMSSFSFGAAKPSATFKSINEVYGVYMDTYNYNYYTVDKAGATSHIKIYGSDQYYKAVKASEASSKWMAKDKKIIEIYFGARTSETSYILSFSKDSKGKIDVRTDFSYGFSNEFKKFKSEAELKKYLKSNADYKKKIKEEASEIKAAEAQKKKLEDRKIQAEKLLSDAAPLTGTYTSDNGVTIIFDGIKSMTINYGDSSYICQKSLTNGVSVSNNYNYNDYVDGGSKIYVNYQGYEDSDLNPVSFTFAYDVNTKTFTAEYVNANSPNSTEFKGQEYRPSTK